MASKIWFTNQHLYLRIELQIHGNIDLANRQLKSMNWINCFSNFWNTNVKMVYVTRRTNYDKVWGWTVFLFLGFIVTCVFLSSHVYNLKIITAVKTITYVFSISIHWFWEGYKITPSLLHICTFFRLSIKWIRIQLNFKSPKAIVWWQPLDKIRTESFFRLHFVFNFISIMHPWHTQVRAMHQIAVSNVSRILRSYDLVLR